MIFAGVGLGIAASGTLVPLLLQLGLRESWYGLGALSALLTLISWTNWPKERQREQDRACGASRTSQPSVTRRPGPARRIRPQCLRAGAAHGLRRRFRGAGLGQGIAAGSRYWVLYGLGAIVGPLITGHLSDRPALTSVARGLPDRQAGFADRLERCGRRLHARHRAAGARTHP